MRTVYLLTILLIASHATFLKSKKALGAYSKLNSMQDPTLDEIWDEWVETVWRWDEAAGREDGYMFDFKTDGWLKYDTTEPTRWYSVEDVPDWVEEGSEYASPPVSHSTDVWRYEVQQIWAYDSYADVEYGYMYDEGSDSWLQCGEDAATENVWWGEVDEAKVPQWVLDFEGEEGNGDDKDEGGDDKEDEWEVWEEWVEQIWGYDNEEGTEHGYMHDWRSDQWMKYDPKGNWNPIDNEEVPQWVHDELDGGEDKEIILPSGDFIDGHYWYGWFDYVNPDLIYLDAYTEDWQRAARWQYKEGDWHKNGKVDLEDDEVPQYLHDLLSGDAKSIDETDWYQGGR